MRKSPLTIISLFDGKSCGQLALQKFLANLEYQYIASEIDRPAMNVTNHRFPKTRQVGDVRNFTGKDLKKIFLLIGGSPCQNFSFAGNHKGMSTKENIQITSLEKYLELKNKGFEFEGQSYLFWEFVRVLRETKPKYFLLENVKMAKKWENIISNELGVRPIHINSNLLTAQNRDRLYWTNIPGIGVPEDKGILLGDVVDGAVSGFGTRGRKKKGEESYTRYSTIRKDHKSNCLTKGGTCRKYVDGIGEVHSLTVENCEVLQGVPVGYTDVLGVTKTDRYHMLGNGWTIPVIEHIFSFIPEFSSQKVNEKTIEQLIEEYEFSN